MKSPTGSVKSRGKKKLARITWTICTKCNKSWPDQSLPCPWCDNDDLSLRRRRERQALVDGPAIEARDIVAGWRRDIHEHGAIREAPQLKRDRTQPEGRTFAALFALCVERYFIPPVWKEGKIIAGMRSWPDSRQRGSTLVELVGDRLVSTITPADCANIRAALHEREVVQARGKLGLVKTGRTLSIATVNHHMKLLRRMLNIAVDEGWISRSPFKKSMINTALESARERVLTAEEESRLLEACRKPRREHLYAIVVVAIETGLRLGEALKLRWRDIDFERGVISPLASHTKALKRRHVGMTDRALTELKRLRDNARSIDLDQPVFGLKSVNTAWRSARAEAGLDAQEFNSDGSLRMERVVFHTLRHTASTNMQAAGVPEGMVQRTLGHANRNMTYRYTHVSVSMAQRVASIMNRRRDQHRARSRMAAAASVFSKSGDTIN